ncbi:MAG: DUF1700 domain-containing protein [Clostridia bacterium]|nr:DUF1700 domain-containing protein [Clostridia bacterium]MDE7328775.1 DUF1700 domain-containing protein [Clostridia bacterium]
MDKNSWLRQLKSELTDRGVTKVERSAVLNYYNEMYQDKLEDGLTEKEILMEFGFPQDVADSVLNDERKEKRWSEKERRRLDRDIYEDVNDLLDEEDAVVEEEYEEERVEKPKKKEVFVTGGVIKFIFSLIFGIVLAALVFSFYLTMVIMIIAGIGVIISSFTAIGQSIGTFAIIFGAGFIVFAIAGVFEIFGKLCAKAFKKVVGKA